jgi:predicted HTH transcriptional regulator
MTTTPISSLTAKYNKVTKKRKKTNVADTSIKAYYEIKAEGLIESEEQLIYRLIQDQEPVTSRQLMCSSSKERGNITRTLFNLVEDGKVKIAYKDKCQTTGKTVRYYATSVWGEEGKVRRAS